MTPVGFFGDRPGLVALVTGAGSEIGAASVRRLIAEGIGRLVLTDRDSAALAATAKSVATLPEENVVTASFNVADESAWGGVASVIRERFGRLDLVVANSGITASGPIVDYPFSEWRRVMAANLDSVFLTLKICLRLIEEGDRGGAIVVVSSAAAIKAEIGNATYGASKAATLQLAKVAAKEGAVKRIRVNAILPGGVEAPMSASYKQQLSKIYKDALAKSGSEQSAYAAMEAAATLGRLSTPEEIAGQIAFLLSDTAGTLSGVALVADGGYTV